MTLGVVAAVGQVLLLALVGLALRLAGVLKPEDAKPLNDIIIYVALPALVFRAIHAADVDVGLLRMAAVAWAVIIAGFALAWLLGSKVMRLAGPTAAGFMLTAALGNTGYLGYPLALSLFGDAGLVRAIFYDIFGTVFAVLTLGIAIASRLGDTGGARPNPLRDIATFPGVIALAAGLLLHPVALPSLAGDVLDALSGLVVPLIMISLGVSLKPGHIKERWTSLSLVALIKLLALPLIAVVVGRLLLGDAESQRLVVMQAGMPSMMLSLVFGFRYRLDVDFIASAILVTTVGAALTVPLFQLLLG